MRSALLPVCCQVLCGPLLRPAACLPALPHAVGVFPGVLVIAATAMAAELSQPSMSSALVLVPLQARKPVTEGEQPQECKQQ